MKSYCHIFLFLILASCFIFVACQPNKPLPETLIQTPVFPASKTTEATPTEIAVPKKAVNHGELLATDTFGNTSPESVNQETAANWMFSFLEIFQFKQGHLALRLKRFLWLPKVSDQIKIATAYTS
jgi:hypothetical protein